MKWPLLLFPSVNLPVIGMDTTFLPDADCENCKYGGEFEDQHCYMFEDKPGDKCGQFKKVTP
jgi:hypothetical protein